MDNKILIYSVNQMAFEKTKKILSGYVKETMIFIDKDHTSKIHLLPHLKQSALVLVDFDYDLDEAIQVVKSIRQLPNGVVLPILGMSANSEVTFLKRLMDIGCSDFILKPYQHISLVERVQRSLMQQIVVDPGGYLLGDKLINQNDFDVVLPQSVPLEWHTDFEIGVIEVDEDHKQIIDQYKRLYLSMREGRGLEDYQDHMNFLAKYVTEHFEREETLQKSSDYPGYEQHKKLHAAFSKRVSQLMQEFNEREVTHRDLIHLNLFIKEWLLRHILVEDRKVGEFIRISKV